MSNSLPIGYTKLAYLKCSGSQYINTGFDNKSGCVAEYEISYDTLDWYQAHLGSIGSNTNRKYMQYYRGYEQYGFNDKCPDIGTSPTVNTVYKYKVSTISGKGYVYVDDVQKINYTNTFGDTSSINLYIFADNFNGTIDAKFKGKGYWFKIWDKNDNLVRDYVPAKRDSDNVVGFYDLVDQKFYTNAGSGAFIAGPDIIDSEVSVVPEGAGIIDKQIDFNDDYYKLDYIENPSDAYIDTGVILNSAFELEMKFQVTKTSIPASGYMLLGQYNGTSTYPMFLYNNNFNTWMVGLQKSQTFDNNIHILKFDSNGKYSWDGVEEQLSAPSLASSLSLHIFKNHWSSGSSDLCCPARIFYLKLSKNGSLVRDYVPVMKKIDNSIGLYDKISDNFYPKTNGSASLTYGHIIGQLTAIPNSGYKFLNWQVLGYTRLEYIESFGAQYIDSGALINCNTDELEYEFEWVSISGSTYDKVFGVVDNNTGAILHQWDYTDNLNTQSIAFGYNTANYKHSLGNYALNTNYNVKVNKNCLTCNDVQTTFSTIATNSISRPYYIFALNNNGNIIQYSRIKLKKFIHRRNGITLYYFIPVIRHSDGAIGMYDLVNFKFYGNSGTGSFIGGNIYAS